MVKKSSGFTLIEVLVSLLLVSLLLGVMVSVVQNAATLNAKATLRSNAGAFAFKKVQDYINLDFDNITVGDVSNNYEIEDFSAEAEELKLKNVSAKVYSEPKSELPSSSVSTTNYTQSVTANTSYVDGPEINSVGQNDATGDWTNISRIRDNNYSNYTHSRFASNPNNLASPSIDLGSSRVVDTIRINWFYCGYGASNFRVEAKNNAPNSNSGWTTIVSGLSDNGVSCSYGSNPQDINVSSNTTPYRHWRLFFVNAENSTFSVVSELEAFSSGAPSDTVEQHGSDASSAPGALYFSNSDIDVSQDSFRGQQSIGIIFRDINATQGATIDNAYINFTSRESHSTDATFIIKGVAVDTALLWVGNFGVDRAVDNNSSDGLVGTTASVTWIPPPWTNNESGPNTQVDVTPILQEIVSRPGWVEGNDVAITIQYVSGSGKRVAMRTPAPRLVIDWSITIPTVPGYYVDVDGDGDVDNPNLLRVTTVIEYDAFYKRYRVEYSTFIRKYGVSD
jgi:prepilin-type N-terminal cleavage/methylation domain-containing protein